MRAPSVADTSTISSTNGGMASDIARRVKVASASPVRRAIAGAASHSATRDEQRGRRSDSRKAAASAWATCSGLPSARWAATYRSSPRSDPATAVRPSTSRYDDRRGVHPLGVGAEQAGDQDLVDRRQPLPQRRQHLHHPAAGDARGVARRGRRIVRLRHSRLNLLFSEP